MEKGMVDQMERFGVIVGNLAQLVLCPDDFLNTMANEPQLKLRLWHTVKEYWLEKLNHEIVLNKDTNIMQAVQKAFEEKLRGTPG